jgi:hypothetical protein
MTRVGSQRHSKKKIIIVLFSRYISNKCLLEECDKEENVEVIGVAFASCLKRRP